MGGSNKYYDQVTEWNISAGIFMLNNIGVKLNNTINEKLSKAPPKHIIIAKGDSAASNIIGERKIFNFCPMSNHTAARLLLYQTETYLSPH